jgi:phosphoserine aminotransferase
MVTIEIPGALLPSDGRFGSGPSKVRREGVEALAYEAPTYLGTSHRQSRVKNVVGEIRSGLVELFGLPEGYEVVLGLGGATAFFDVCALCLVEEKSQHCSFGEFSQKFADAVSSASHLLDPEVITSEAGTHPDPIVREGIDIYALTHNETTTGVQMPIVRPRDKDGRATDGRVVVDATSAAGGLRFDPNETDVYFFSPQKSFGSEGGLWLALCSPRAVERAQRVGASGRYIPAFLDLTIAIENSRLNQTYNTPGLATLFLLANQIAWFNDHGGLEWAAGRSDRSAEILYGWAERSSAATPFVHKPDERSHVIGTIDFNDQIDAKELATVLRANGIVDTEPYRKLGRNQLRIAMFPGIEPTDVQALTGCIDYVLERL